MPFHFIHHNFKYYLFPDTNHLILGFEDDPSLVDKRYKNRKKFLKEVDSLGFNSLDVTSVKECLGGPLTETLKECINFDKFLNDWYRYHILEQKEGLVDKHDFSVFSPIFK